MDTAADFLGASFLSDVQVKTCVFCEHNAMVSCVPAPIVHTLPCDKLRVVNVSQTESLDDLLQFTFIVKMPSLLQRQLQTDVKMNICERCSSYLVAFDLPRECHRMDSCGGKHTTGNAWGQLECIPTPPVVFQYRCIAHA